MLVQFQLSFRSIVVFFYTYNHLKQSLHFIFFLSFCLQLQISSLPFTNLQIALSSAVSLAPSRRGCKTQYQVKFHENFKNYFSKAKRTRNGEGLRRRMLFIQYYIILLKKKNQGRMQCTHKVKNCLKYYSRCREIPRTRIALKRHSFTQLQNAVIGSILFLRLTITLFFRVFIYLEYQCSIIYF